MINIKEVKKAAVFRALQLGDLMCSIPAVRALKLSNPEMEITLIGLPWAKSFVTRFNMYYHEFICFPGYPGLPEQPFEKVAFDSFVEEMQRRNFNLLLQMQGNGTIVNPLLQNWGAKFLAGFDPRENIESADLSFIKYPNEGHEIDRHLALMANIGVSPAGDFLEFPISSQDMLEYELLALPIHPGQYVCVHAGSRGAWRQWPPLYFANIADYCNGMGYTIVLTGTTDELHIVEEVAVLMKNTPVVTAGKTSMGSLAVLIKQAAALLSNCTGVAHMASALETPSVVMSMDGEPWRWAPKNKALHTCIDWTREPDYDLVQQAVTDLLVRISQ